MSKPSIQNITTTQTFQNWLDKTNEIVDIIRDSALTASVSGDTTFGDATLVGEFTANTVVVFDELLVDNIESRTPGQPVVFGNGVKVTAAGSPIAAIFEYGASGAKTRYTNNVTSWDIGYDNTTNANFQMNFGSGGQFSLSPTGVLTVPSLITSTDLQIGTNLTILGNLNANTAQFASANGSFTGLFAGNFTGDVYHPAGNKVFENGGPAANIPAVFTGNVNGTVSSLTNHTADALVEKALSPVNLYFTTARARASVSGGTGVSYDANTGVIALNTDTVRSSLSGGTGITYNSTTGSIAIATTYTEGINNAIAAANSVKGYITFDGTTGEVFVSKNLTLSKSGLGTYFLTCAESIRNGSNNWGVLLGNVDVGEKERSAGGPTDYRQVDVYSTFVSLKSEIGFEVSATRRFNTVVHYGGNDNNAGNIFGITAVDPTYVSLFVF
jgi:hypothetical protein